MIRGFQAYRSSASYPGVYKSQKASTTKQKRDRRKVFGRASTQDDTLNHQTTFLTSLLSTVFFSQGSRIIASSHTFEYVGSGNDIVTATPKRGGVLDQENEVLTEDGGKVLYTSTDQAGNFRIGDDLKINQETGTISGRAFSKSLFSEMTPFILALS